ncbi:MAG TPA: hypothetical protein VGN34_00210, partial [Ktedonobacteraceae bacterium]
MPLGSGLSFSLPQVFQPLRLRQSAADGELQQQDEHNEIERDENARGNDEAEEQRDVPIVLVENGIEALNKS